MPRSCIASRPPSRPWWRVPDSADHPAITIDREACTGHGVCIQFAPSTFAHDAETKVIVIDASGDTIEYLSAAAEGCPTGAIVLVPQQGE